MVGVAVLVAMHLLVISPHRCEKIFLHETLPGTVKMGLSHAKSTLPAHGLLVERLLRGLL